MYCVIKLMLLQTLPALIGKNRSYIGGWMFFSFYLPGNSLAHPPSPRAGGITVNEEDVQGFLRVPSLPSGDWEDEPS